MQHINERENDGIMNEQQKEKLTAVLREILAEDTADILHETGEILARLTRDESLPVLQQAVYGMLEKTILTPHTEPAPHTTLPAPQCKTFGTMPVARTSRVVSQPDAPAEDAPGIRDPGPPGLYVYGIVAGTLPGDTRLTGIDGQMVFAVPFRDVSAIVHRCPLTPYRSDNESVMKEWVLAHQNVQEGVAEACGTFVPLCFDMIIAPEERRSAEDVLLEWIAGEYDGLLEKMEKVRGRKEYGVQVLYRVPEIVKRVTASSARLKALQEGMEGSSRGTVYMNRLKMEQELKKEIELELKRIEGDCHRRIASFCDDIKVGTVKKTGDGDERMLLNYSCLVSDEKYAGLGDALESLENDSGLAIRFTGPWQCYSFV